MHDSRGASFDVDRFNISRATSLGKSTISNTRSIDRSPMRQYSDERRKKRL